MILNQSNKWKSDIPYKTDLYTYNILLINCVYMYHVYLAHTNFDKLLGKYKLFFYAF